MIDFDVTVDFGIIDAGISGVDVVILVVAADEGIMPQTREHLDILSLLEVKNGIVALTKTDTVDEAWIELISEEIREGLAGTFMADAQIVPFSSVTGRGREELINALDAAAAQKLLPLLIQMAGEHRHVMCCQSHVLLYANYSTKC